MNVSIALKTLLGVVNQCWPFDSTHYPQLKDRGQKEVRAFGIDHMGKHVSKEAGWIARILERQAHRESSHLGQRDLRRVRKLGIKLIVVGVRLLLLTGGTPEEAEKYILRQK